MRGDESDTGSKYVTGAPALTQKINKEHKEQLQQDATCDYSLLCRLLSLISSIVKRFFSFLS